MLSSLAFAVRPHGDGGRKLRSRDQVVDDLSKKHAEHYDDKRSGASPAIFSERACTEIVACNAEASRQKAEPYPDLTVHEEHDERGCVGRKVDGLRDARGGPKAQMGCSR